MASYPDRGSAASRGYDADWKRLRLWFLAQHPMCQCEQCREQGEIAAVVDHIISISERPDLRLDITNLRSMAKRCHDRRTAQDQGFNKGKSIKHRGCDVSGKPTDGRHHWNQ